MKTKLIGLKEFRLHLASLAKEIEKDNICLIVLNKNKPVLQVSPIKTNYFEMEKLKEEVKEAREQFKKGEYFSEDEVSKMFE